MVPVSCRRLRLGMRRLARCAWCAVTRGMAAACCCVTAVGFTGIVSGSAGAMPHGCARAVPVTGCAQAAAWVAHLPPAGARGPMALALRLVREVH
jgi:hypothetical protein